MNDSKVITYAVRKFVQGGKCTIVQKLNGFDANEYDAYDYGTYFSLYPKRRIVPSEIPLEKHHVSLFQTRREYS